MKERFHIQILGQEFNVVSDSGEEHVARVVKYVNEKVEEIERKSSNINSLNVAILAALNIADEYLKSKGTEEVIYSQIESRYKRLMNLISEIK